MPPKYVDDIYNLFKERSIPHFIKPEPRPPPRQITSLGPFLNEIKNIQLPPTGEPPLELNEARIRRRMQKVIANQKKLDAFIANYHPKENKNALGDPSLTFFIGNIPKEVDEEWIRKEFDVFGKIRRVSFVEDIVTHERRPYCFLEFEDKKGFENALSQGSRLYYNNQKIIVDTEKARTVDGWLPRRLGGGIGAISRRFTKQKIVMENSIPSKKRKIVSRCGRRYQGNIRDFSRRREEKLGISQHGTYKSYRFRPRY